MTHQPLFILAPPRSFTSVVCAMLGQHPQMYGLPEVNLFACDTYQELKKFYRLRPGFQHGLLRSVAELGLGGQTESNVATAKDWLEEFIDSTTGEIFRDLAEWAAPRQLVEKSPAHVYKPEAMARMQETFPHARYLHLLRHPKPCVESMFRLRGEIQDKLANSKLGGMSKKFFQTQHERLTQFSDPDALWLKPHLDICEFLEGIADENQLRIRGEDFLASPDEHLLLVTEWLGIRSDAQAIDAMKHPERSPFACYGPGNAKFGNDPSFLEAPALREFKPKNHSLEGALDGTDGLILSENLRRCAVAFGYDRSAAAAPSADTADEDLVFVLAPAGSYGEALVELLAQHPDLAGACAGALFGHDGLAESDPAVNGSDDGSARPLELLGVDGLADDARSAVDALVQRGADARTVDVLSELLEQSGKSRLVVYSAATLADADAVERMLAQCPNASFLHLTCHPLTYGQQQMRPGAGGQARPEQIWVDAHGNGAELAVRLAPGQCMRVRGEDVFAHPDIFIPQILEWLELDNDSGTVQVMIQLAAAARGNRGRSAHEPRWPLPDEQGGLADPLPWAPAEHFEPPLVKLAKEFGYQ